MTSSLELCAPRPPFAGATRKVQSHLPAAAGRGGEGGRPIPGGNRRRRTVVRSSHLHLRLRLRNTGVAAVAVLWTTLGVASAVAGFDLLGERPLSDLGTDPGSTVLFGGGLVGAALLFVGFHAYVRDRFPVSATFSVAMLGGMAGQLVAGVVPIGGDGAAHRVHTAAALLLGASLPVLMWRFAAAQQPGPWRRATYGLFWAEAVACAAGLYLSSRRVAALAEILPAVVFHGWTVAVTVAADPAHRPRTNAPRSLLGRRRRPGFAALPGSTP